MASELQAQKFVHELEHGKGKWWVWLLVIVLVTAYQVVCFIALNPIKTAMKQEAPPQFVGLTHAKGMEQAVISRELVRGNGFSTTSIKPAAINLLNKKKGEAAFENILKPDGPTRGHVPDFYHGPLNPWVNAAVLKLAVSINDKTKWRADEASNADFWTWKTGELISPADKIIAGVALLFFLGAVLVNYFTAKLLFDQRLAVLGVILTLCCYHFWKFSGTGLPQMLMLFLFSLALLLYAKAMIARDAQRLVWPWLLGVGLCFGLLSLAHALTIFILAGLLFHSVFAFRPFGKAAAYLAVMFLVCFVPWCMRNSQVCGDFKGLGWVTQDFQIRGTESQLMRTLTNPDEQIEPTNRIAKIQGQTIEQIGNFMTHYGKMIVAPFFFLALLHPFRKPETRSMQWAVFSMWLCAVFGMSYFGFSDYDLLASLQSNDLHLLFIPIFTLYGLALVLMFWGRVTVGDKELASVPLFNRAFQTLVVLLHSMSLLNVHLQPPRLSFVWPPYIPLGIAQLNEWYSEKDVICADMPWAIAWYADRRSIWVPLSVTDFNDLNDFKFNAKITGLFFSPVTGFRGLQSDVAMGEFREWYAFITRDARAAGNFPLKTMKRMQYMVGYQYILYADRDRWTERNN
jgi:hypothetical protein